MDRKIREINRNKKTKKAFFIFTSNLSISYKQGSFAKKKNDKSSILQKQIKKDSNATLFF